VDKKERMVLTSDFVHTMPTFVSLARCARFKTSETPTSLVARPMLQTAKISSHSRKYRSVIFTRAELRSRRPIQVVRYAGKHNVVMCLLTGQID
jgi:hypothetical protein